MRAIRLAWRMQRWELAVLVGGGLLLAIAMALVAWQLDDTQLALEQCYANATGGDRSARCRALVDWSNKLDGAAAVLPGVSLVLPFGAGILLGAPLVAREVEKRTAPIAWSLSRSRQRWLVGRLFPVLVAVVVSLLAVGAASEAVLLASSPDAELGFADFGYHGPLIAARGAAVLIIGVLVGLVMGRVLPAILVAGVLAIALSGGLTFVRSQMMRADAMWIPVPPDGGNTVTTIYDQGWTDDATGEFLTYDEASARFPEEFGPEGSWNPPGLTMVYLATPPELYPAFAWREIGALAGVSLLIGALALWLVGYRRPD